MAGKRRGLFGGFCKHEVFSGHEMRGPAGTGFGVRLLMGGKAKVQGKGKGWPSLAITAE